VPGFRYKNETIVVAIVIVTAIVVYLLWRIKPVPGAKVSSGYGIRTLNGTTAFHNGIDLAASEGTRVKAAAAGKVIATGFDNTNGNYVKIKHLRNSTFYGHLSKITVRKNQIVVKGQKIGEVGNTGYSFGPHVHFIVWNNNGETVDPAKSNLIRV
jgi:murein DD-endopeptidase MepM/ murein hydrolase activator NlpD